MPHAEVAAAIETVWASQATTAVKLAFEFLRNPISITRLPRLLQNHKIAAVPHGFRSSFRDWAAEETNHPREVVEAALAHVVANQTEAAYARSDLFKRRRRLMEDLFPLLS